MNKIFLCFLIFIFSLKSIFSVPVDKGCEVSLTLYRANMEPLSNELVTFKSDDGGHQVDIITSLNGYCLLTLNQNTHYNIIYDDITYKEMIKIPEYDELKFNGPMVIDGGLFVIIEVEVFDNINDYQTLKNEKIFCENTVTGKKIMNTTNNKGLVKFYVPRNHQHKIHSVFDDNIAKYVVKEGKNATVFGVKLRASTTPENEYYNRLKEAEADAIAREKQIKYDDSIIGNIPITVILFANIDQKTNEGKGIYSGPLMVYKSRNKTNYLGSIKGNWNVEGLCENGKRLCLGSVTNNDGSYSNMVLPVKLKRGNHEFYVENKEGNIKQEFKINIPSANSLYFIFSGNSDPTITAPICIEY